MLTKLIVENFKSFSKKTQINVTATGYEILSKINKTDDNILKGLLFVGANATGKSTILEIMKFILDFIVLDVKIDFNRYISLINIKPVKIEYHFKFNDKNVCFFIEFSPKGIRKEILKIDNNIIIDRNSKITKYYRKDGSITEIQNISNDQSVLRSIYFDTKFSEYECLQQFMKFLENSAYINQDFKQILVNENINYFNNYFEANGTNKINKFLEKMEYFQEVKFSDEIKTDKYSMKFTDNLNNASKQIIFKRKDSNLELPYKYESSGNQTLVHILPIVIKTLETPSMLIIDEFSSSLHNILEEKIIKLFMTESSRSQLFVVSHSTNLLTNLIYRPDQIYTVDYDNEIGSVIDRVSNHKPREAQNLEKMYLSGVFNGI